MAARPVLVAPSFNGRTAASGAAYRGSNPWGATKSKAVYFGSRLFRIVHPYTSATNSDIVRSGCPRSGRCSLSFLFAPIIGTSHNPRTIILRSAHPNRVQSRRRVGRTECNQITVPRVLRRIHHPLLKAFIAGKCRVLPTAH